MAARDRAAAAPFRAMYGVLDDAAALVTRFGSLSAAAERLDALECKNAELEAARDASAQRIADLETRALLSPSKVIDVLQRECTCVGDVGLLKAMLAESLGSKTPGRSKHADVRVILSVHQVTLGEANATEEVSAPSGADGVGDFAAEFEMPAERSEPVEPIVADSVEPRRRLKRRRKGKSAAVKTEAANPLWTDRIQDRIRAWRSVVGGNGETTYSDAMRSTVEDSGAHASAGDTRDVITRRDQIDTSPGSWARLGVEVAISRLGEKALSWSPPEDLMDAIEERQRAPPALTIESFNALDAARPWHLVYLQRCDVSYTFTYRDLKPKAKAFVRAVRWFQFSYCRELWEWMHWIPMAKKNRAAEWEAYRRDRNERSAKAVAAWDALCKDAIKLVRDELIPVDFFLDPSVWVMRYYQWLTWKPSTTDLVSEQAVEDARYPSRSFYVTNLDAHPFFSSPFSQLYTTAHALPRITDVDGKREVHLDHAGTGGTPPCPTSWGTTEIAPAFRVVAISATSARAGVDVKPSASVAGGVVALGGVA